MANHRLTWFLQDNNIINKYLCGFQKGKRTTDHLVRLETYIRLGFVKKSTYSWNIFLFRKGL